MMNKQSKRIAFNLFFAIAAVTIVLIIVNLMNSTLITDKLSEGICMKWLETKCHSYSYPHMSFQCKSVVRNGNRISVIIEERNKYYNGLDADGGMDHLFDIDSKTGEILGHCIEIHDEHVILPPPHPPIEMLEGLHGNDGWKLGMPCRVDPESTDLPDNGSALLGTLVGWREAFHIFRATSDFIYDFTVPFEYMRGNGTTLIRFPRGWEITIDDATGQILPPKGMPDRSDEEISELTKNYIVKSGEYERFCDDFCPISSNNHDLVDMEVKEIKRVSDKIIVVSRLIFSASAESCQPSAIVFWIDGWTGEVFRHFYQYNGS